MTAELTRSEKNRKIAEALEPHQSVFDWAIANPKLNKLLRQPSPKGAWILRNLANVLEPCDFYADEPANALVLEAMLSQEDIALHFMKRNGRLQLTLFRGIHGINADAGTEFYGDRKTAICEAFLKWKDANA